jgi:hypothetical protein
MPIRLRLLGLVAAAVAFAQQAQNLPLAAEAAPIQK